MKLPQSLAVLLAVSAVSGSPAPLKKRHYTFPAIDSTSDWQYVRQTTNYQSNAGLADVNSDQLRCYQAGTQGAKSTMAVAAGGSVTFKSSPNIFHPGPIQFYMAKVPDGQDVTTWDGKGEVWFKIYAEKAISSGGQLSWASLNKGSFSATIPKNLQSGDYLLRIEHIALHQASSTGGAQFYISCAQVKVTGGGSGTPSPLVSFPGVYKASDPGIKINIYSAAGTYTPPGPPVWQG
ncbi:uncharacterized protein LY89DRAFT_667422 [Mollisia scopiformis]|uniref:lytic cellulose monooxygenase (C4-dehydrogenating) n=1 Tax=Mollisia scopiformis TaxID=149040 RepID=A0A194XH71_MOLSC|nr:uncharacterized protein LY89DRAFT_667422 [Mollisia scopiformis]KUJ19474.1 hypothetical protein LY89DRAFT_667422 [Mollisia scopiformis]